MSQTITLELPDAVFAVVQQAATDCKLSPTEWLYAGLVLTWYESEARLYTESKDAADAEFKAELRAMGPWGRLGKRDPNEIPLTKAEAKNLVDGILDQWGEDMDFSEDEGEEEMVILNFSEEETEEEMAELVLAGEAS